MYLSSQSRWVLQISAVQARWILSSLVQFSVILFAQNISKRNKQKENTQGKTKQKSRNSELQWSGKIETVKKGHAFSDLLSTNKKEGQLTKPDFRISF
jgi:hypothetical protein